VDSKEKLDLICNALDERKAVDEIVIPVTGLTQMTDYMVICSGTSNIHIRAVADRVNELMKAHGIKGTRMEGYSEARWVLMDFGDVVLHIFDPEAREFYQLEQFWTAREPVAA
jgi:ribosome-associated protein